MKLSQIEILQTSPVSGKLKGRALSGSRGQFLTVFVAASALLVGGCSEKKEPSTPVAEPEKKAAADAPPATAPAVSVPAPAGDLKYTALNADAEDSLWTGLRAVQETAPTAGLTFRIQAVEGDAGREALAKDLAAKLKKAGFESVVESVKPDAAKPSGSAVVKCHFTRAQLTEKVFRVVGRHYISGQFELRSDDDTPRGETIVTIYAKPVFADTGKVSFE